MMGFKITKDYLQTVKDRTGTKTNDYQGGQFKFRLLTDDGDLIYEGVSDENHDPDPLDFGQWDAGCTTIQYYNEETKKWETVI